MKSSVPGRSLRPLETAELSAVYRALHGRFGHQKWWPAETPLEMMLGAILTQNAAWTNVEKALANLKKSKCLSLKRLAAIPEKKLAALIRPSGYFNLKAKKIKAFVRFFEEEYGGSIKRMASENGEVLRGKLLNVWGVGPETADSILLYAAGKPFFVIDAYTLRIFKRHGIKIPKGMGFPRTLEKFKYADWQRLFMHILPPDTPLYNDFHAQIVHTAKHHCKSREMSCSGCPLELFLEKKTA